MKNLIIVLILTLNIFAFTPDDIKAMRDFGVLVSFNDTDKVAKISEKMTPKEFLNVVYLNFNNSPIYNIPEWISRLTKLKGLNLNGAKINLDELKKISSLKELTVLNLSNNNLFDGVANSKELMSILSNFHLNELTLSNTGGNLCNYADIGSLESLIELELAHNKFNKIGDTNCTFEAIGLSKLNKLKVLDLSNNNIDGDFNTEFLPINSLVDLNLSVNNIQNFKYYKPLPSLEVLDLSKNASLKIADNYGGLFSLKRLVQLKRESNIKIPKGLQARLSKLQTKKTNISITTIMKKIGIEKTHIVFDNSVKNDLSISEVPMESIFYLKKDLTLPKGHDSQRISNRCAIEYIADYKDTRVLKEGKYFTVKIYDSSAHRYQLFFDKKELLSRIECDDRSGRNLYRNDFFLLFLKKPKEFTARKEK